MEIKMATYSYQLTMRAGPNPGRIFNLTGVETFIGRDASNSFPIADPEISRRHARVTFQSGYFVIEDLNSTNGTFVNGNRLVGQYVLQPGDVLNLGENVTLVFEAVTFDPDATLVSSPSYAQPAEQRPAPPVSAYAPPSPIPISNAAYPDYPSRPAPAYVGQVPQGPDDFEPMPAAPRSKTLPWVLAGAGCLTIVCAVTLAVFWYIDANFLWCSVFPFIPGCP
jgi:hypothetical protein